MLKCTNPGCDNFRQLVHMGKEKYPSKNTMILSVQTRAKCNLKGTKIFNS
jgi:hypothetical protein